MQAPKKCVATLHSHLIALTNVYQQGSRPANGHQRNFVSKTTNTLGKYPQSLGTHPGWSRRQYIRDCASGANSTPLGSPRRMSPVDPLAVEPSLSSANAASVTEHREGKKRDSEAAVAVCLIRTSTAFAYLRLCRAIYRMGQSRKKRRGNENTMIHPKNITGETWQQQMDPLPRWTDPPRSAKGSRWIGMALYLRPNPQQRVLPKIRGTKRSRKGKRRRKKKIGQNRNTKMKNTLRHQNPWPHMRTIIPKTRKGPRSGSARRRGKRVHWHTRATPSRGR